MAHAGRRLNTVTLFVVADRETLEAQPNRFSKESPSLHRTRHRGQEDSPSWYFPGVPLGLDVFPGISGAGRVWSQEKYREHQGTTGGPVTVAA